MMTLFETEFETTSTPLDTKSIVAINSLGGRPLPFGQHPMHAKVTLANYAASDIQLWQLDVIPPRLIAKQPGAKPASLQAIRISA